MMRVAINSYPFNKYFHDGPKVFLDRLADSIINQKLAKITSNYSLNYDVALFSVTKKFSFFKPYFLRVDGIYFDKLNSKTGTELENKKIFTSIEGAHGIIFISEFCKKIVEKFHKKIQKPFKIIHNGVPLNLFRPYGFNYRKKLGFSKKDKVLVTSAHWRRHKRLPETIKLLRILNEKYNNSFKLIVLGKTDIKKIEEKNIFYIGEVSPKNLSPWYRTGDAYIHLAWIEPCGNTQIEAMACGLPVLCCNNGGIGETVENATGGIVSQCDKLFKFEKVDYYSPPEPNYDRLIKDINFIFKNLDKFKRNINFSYLDINSKAKEYIAFIEKNYVKD
jgi:glycosyltransferase involved in cell wall biosynthesis